MKCKWEGYICFGFFETGCLSVTLGCPGTCTVDPAGLELLKICLPLPCGCWDVLGKLFVQSIHSANKATLNQRTESVIRWPGLAIEFLKDFKGLLQGQEERRNDFWDWGSWKMEGEGKLINSLLSLDLTALYLNFWFPSFYYTGTI